jgi:hypothetical protein
MSGVPTAAIMIWQRAGLKGQKLIRPSNNIDVYLEIGKKRTFAGAIDWPGWCRIGRDEGSALQALVDYGPRYARILSATPLGFQAPADASALAVVERLEGNATTDFGAPAVAPSSDTRPVDDAGRSTRLCRRR